MTRSERHAQIKTLRNEGLLLREIGERLGLATSTVHDYLQDPTGDDARRRKRRYEHPCIDCGKTINPNGIERFGSGRCGSCHNQWERKLTKRWIVDSFRAWTEQFGVPPVATDWSPAMARYVGREDKIARYESTGRPWPSPPCVIDNFGTWNAGRAAAGFDVFDVGHYGREGEDPTIVAETVELYRSGLSAAEVGERMGCSGSAVVYRLEMAGEPRRSGPFGLSGIGLINAQKTHCPQGHLYDEVNTYYRANGGRQCKTCHREFQREYKRRQRAVA